MAKRLQEFRIAMYSEASKRKISYDNPKKLYAAYERARAQIRYLSACGSRVKSVSCDGATPFMPRFRQHGCDERIQHRVVDHAVSRVVVDRHLINLGRHIAIELQPADHDLLRAFSIFPQVAQRLEHRLDHAPHLIGLIAQFAAVDAQPAGEQAVKIGGVDKQLEAIFLALNSSPYPYALSMAPETSADARAGIAIARSRRDRIQPFCLYILGRICCEPSSQGPHRFPLSSLTVLSLLPHYQTQGLVFRETRCPPAGLCRGDEVEPALSVEDVPLAKAARSTRCG